MLLAKYTADKPLRKFQKSARGKPKDDSWQLRTGSNIRHVKGEHAGKKRNRLKKGWKREGGAV